MKVMIATPSRDGMTHLKMAQSVNAFCAELMKRGITHQWVTVGATYVQVGRDILSHFFLQGDWTHLFFIDSDVVFHPNQALDILERDLDVCAGIYPVKEIFWAGIKSVAEYLPPEGLCHVQAKNMVYRLPEEANDPVKDPSKEIEVTGAATGLMCIKRSVMERYKDAYYETQHYNWGEHGEICRFFMVGYLPEYHSQAHKNEHYGEDIWWCQMIRELGIKIHVIPGITVGHIGNHTFYGCAFCASGNIIHKFGEGGGEKFE